MNYCQEIREKIGNDPLIVVRPSVAIMNQNGEILLSRYINGIWNIPGDVLQLNQSVEECIKRKVHNDIGLEIKTLTLFGVYSGKELINRVQESGDEYHNVAIGYVCTDYEGDITSGKNQAIEAKFFNFDHLPKEINPFIKNKLAELKGQLGTKNTPYTKK